MQIQYWQRAPWFSVCVYGSLGCGVCDRPVHPSCCSESLFPKPVTVAAGGLRDPTRHINLHLKGNCPMPRLCFVCEHVRALQPHKPDVKYDVHPTWLWIGLAMHHGWSGDGVCVCCKHQESCSSLTDYWSILKINADNILCLSSSLLCPPFESFPHVCAGEHKPDNHENKRKRQREGRVRTLVSIKWRPGHCSPNGKIQHTLMTETCCCLHTSTSMLMCEMS